MFFRPKNFCRRKHPLKNANHHLFIELRTRRKKCLFVVVVVNTKCRGTTFTVATNKHWVLVFNKPFSAYRFPKGLYGRGLNGKNITRTFPAKRKRKIIQICIQI